MLFLTPRSGFTILSAAALLSAVSAQWSNGGIPPCGAKCAEDSAAVSTTCTATDARCLCNSDPFVNAVYECLDTSCDYADTNSSIGHLGQICQAANSAPASSTTPAAPPATTGPSTSVPAPAGGSSTPAVPPPAGGTTPSTPAAPGATTPIPPVAEGTTPAAGGVPAAETPAVPSTTATRSFTTEPAAGAAAGTTPAAGAAGPRTTPAPAAGAGQGTSTKVVVSTVGNNTTAGANGGNNILDGNGAGVVGVNAVIGVVAAFVGAVVML
jgi:hypothetical protein